MIKADFLAAYTYASTDRYSIILDDEGEWTNVQITTIPGALTNLVVFKHIPTGASWTVDVDDIAAISLIGP